MTKIFPKSRICVLDVYPSFEEGLKNAILFANKHNIALNTKDGQKIIFSYCLKSIEDFYKKQTTTFPKVTCIGTKPKSKNIDYFINTHFQTIMDYFPVPYCGSIDFNSPDLECIAQKSLEQNKSQRKFKKLANKLSLRY